MDNTLLLVLALLFGGAGMISIFAIVNLVLPAPVARTRAVIETNLFRSLLLGFVNSLFIGLIGFLMMLPARGGGLVAAICVGIIGLIGIFTAALVLVGMVAITSLLGDKIGETNSPVTTHLRGGGLLVLACLTPYFGWLVFTPLVIWVSLGASVQTIFRKKEKVAVEAK